MPRTSHFTRDFTITLPISVTTKPQETSTAFLTSSSLLAANTTTGVQPTTTTATTSTTTEPSTTKTSTSASIVPQKIAVETSSVTSTTKIVNTTTSAVVTQNENRDYEYDDGEDYDSEVLSNDDETKERKRRSTDEENDMWGSLTPGACIKGCAFGFYTFSIVSSVINCFGASGRIGNLLVNYRCVSHQDKSVTQGLILMLVSLFALIPGPILFGRIIDQTCLVWTEDQCSGRRGNCQFYDQRLFRYYINLTAFFLTGIGVFFDVLVWKFGKNLDLYGEREEEMMKRQKDSRNGRNY
jgi:hypothetical protein